MNMHAPIPNFGLYGSHHEWDVPGPLHCETIRSRSEKHEWNIAPHRHENLHQFLHIIKGQVDATLDGRAMQLHEASVVYVPPLTVHGYAFSPGTRGHVVSLQARGAHEDLLRYLESGLAGRSYLVVDTGKGDARAPGLSAQFAAVHAELAVDRPVRNLAIEGHLRLLLALFLRAVHARDEVLRDDVDEDELLVRRFKDLVDSHYREQQPLGHYLARLGVGEGRLTAACRRILDKTPKAVCHQRLLLEAKRLLQYTALSNGEISYDLGFRDPAYFCRFFKSRTGQSPGTYRTGQAATRGAVAT